jgi:hypothetical protein
MESNTKERFRKILLKEVEYGTINGVYGFYIKHVRSPPGLSGIRTNRPVVGGESSRPKYTIPEIRQKGHSERLVCFLLSLGFTGERT